MRTSERKLLVVFNIQYKEMQNSGVELDKSGYLSRMPIPAHKCEAVQVLGHPIYVTA